jgi:isoleucyl-tRNA synthetase
MAREEFVLDTWHNSGSAPFSSLTDDEYESKIPAPFFTEGIDQTRGWAYTLLVENVIYNNQPISPYKSFLFQGHVLDENGNKMSKSKGNVLEASDLLDNYPADLIRFYFMWKASPIEPLNFSTKELMSRPFQIISTLYHLHLYFKQNSEYDKFDVKASTVQWAKQNNLLTPPDIWVLSKLQRMIQKTTQYNNDCKFHESAKAIEDFLINSLSQVYIPITKSELWAEDETKKDRRFTIYAILAETLKMIDILIHPFSPFTSEYLYLSIFGDKETILLENWPKSDQNLTDEKIEESFDLMKEIVSISAATRMKGKLKRRWPLENALICVGKDQKQILESLSDLLKTQINVEEFEIFEAENQDGFEQFLELSKLGLPVIPKIELERKAIGPKAKKDMGKLLQIFSETNPNDIIKQLVETGSYTFDVGSNKILLNKEDFIINFDVESDYQFANRGNLVVILSIQRNQEMMAKGLVKDLARRIQTLRKERGYNPTDILDKASILDLDKESLELIKRRVDEISFLVRVKQVDFEESCKEYKNDDIDGQKIRISVQ